jgi:hypothetical protein
MKVKMTNLLIGCGKKAEERVHIVMIDGVIQIQSPRMPINGRVVLN